MDSPDQDRQRSARARRVVDRVVDLQRDPATGPADAEEPPPAAADEAPATELDELRRRVRHLERELEALQDQVYRETRRYDEELADLRTQLEPANVARALSADARRRGL